MPPPRREDLILLGAIAGAFGVRGEVRVRSFTADPEAILRYGPLLDADGALVLTPLSARPVKDGLAITSREVKSREAAEALRNTGLHVPRALLPSLDEEEYYHVDLIGCRVEALDGTVLGEVRAVPNFGAGDLLDVRLAAGGRQWFVAFTKTAVPIVDLANHRLVCTEDPNRPVVDPYWEPDEDLDP